MIENLQINVGNQMVDAALARPSDGRVAPGIIVLTDIFGLRPAFDSLCERIAARGYVVMAPNIFYRAGKPPFFEAPIDFQNEKTKATFEKLRAPFNAQVLDSDGAAYVDALAMQPRVASGPMGVVGFCFAGKFSLHTAAARPDRIKAAASFHGGGLCTDDPDSPHLLLPKIKAALYIGHAENDRSMPQEAIDKLDDALADWAGDYETKTYPARHGWMIEGREVYNAEQAARGFEKMMELFDKSLNSPVAR